MNEPPDYDDLAGGNVLVFRNADSQPVAVPSDVVTAAERAYRCYMDRVGGMSWVVIAEREGYPSASAAYYDVKRYMEEARALVVEQSQREMLTLEVARYDALQHAIWPQAMTGHIPSVLAAANIISKRTDLVGLDPDKMNEAADEARRTVVVPNDSAGYIAAMQRAAEPEPPTGSTVDPDRTEQGESNAPSKEGSSEQER
jgi:hypothetical protein